jgi:hypothetical protein
MSLLLLFLPKTAGAAPAVGTFAPATTVRTFNA